MSRQIMVEGIDISRDGPIGSILLNRPEKMNAITMMMRDELRLAVEELDADPEIRVIIVRGAGNRAFSAGGDIAGFLELRPDQLTTLHHNIGAPERCGKPVISAVNGYCFGAGFEFSLACDFIIATDSSEFALPEIKLGMIPGSGGSQRVVRRVGIARAKDMIMRGRRVSASEADAWGLITTAVPESEWKETIDEIANELTSYSLLALKTLKTVLNNSLNGPLSTTMNLEGIAYGMLRSSEDFREGVEAFLEKRSPEFRGR